MTQDKNYNFEPLENKEILKVITKAKRWPSEYVANLYDKNGKFHVGKYQNRITNPDTGQKGFLVGPWLGKKSSKEREIEVKKLNFMMVNNINSLEDYEKFKKDKKEYKKKSKLMLVFESNIIGKNGYVIESKDFNPNSLGAVFEGNQSECERFIKEQRRLNK